MSNQVYRREGDPYLIYDKEIRNFTSALDARMKGQRVNGGAPYFLANTALLGDDLVNDTWNRIAAGSLVVGQFGAEASASPWLAYSSKDWTFDPLTGAATCGRAGKYKFDARLTFQRGITTLDVLHVFSFSSGGSAPLVSWPQSSIYEQVGSATIQTITLSLTSTISVGEDIAISYLRSSTAGTQDLRIYEVSLQITPIEET